MFNSSINRSLFGAITFMKAQKSIDIMNWNKKKEYKSKKKIELFLQYHCSPDIVPVYHFLRQNKINLT